MERKRNVRIDKKGTLSHVYKGNAGGKNDIASGKMCCFGRPLQYINRNTCKWLLFLLVLFTSCIFGFSNEPMHLSVSQAYVDLPTIIAYVDILDSSGNKVPGITKEQFSTTVGQQAADIKELIPFEKTSEGTAYIVLVDISKTLREKEFKQIRESLTIWIENLKSVDRMSMITFGTSCKVVVDFTADKVKLKEIVKDLKPSDFKTKLYEALDRAVEMGKRRDENLPTRRVVVVLGDGKDESTGLKEEDIKNKIKEYHFPIYSIGYSRLPAAERQKYLDVLSNFSAVSGGVYVKAKKDNLQEMYKTIQESILRVYRLTLHCSECRADGKMYRLQVNLTSGTRKLPGGMDIRLLKAPPPPSPIPSPTPSPGSDQKNGKKFPAWYHIIGIIVLLLFIIILFFILKSKKKISETEEEENLKENDKIAKQPEVISREGKVKPKGINIRLVEIGAKGKGGEHEVVLADRIVIGRKAGCDLVLEDDPDISREHCELVFENEGVLIRDLDSSHGTKVNGVPITGRYRLESGDKILLGRTELRLIFERGKT